MVGSCPSQIAPNRSECEAGQRAARFPVLERKVDLAVNVLRYQLGSRGSRIEKNGEAASAMGQRWRWKMMGVPSRIKLGRPIEIEFTVVSGIANHGYPDSCLPRHTYGFEPTLRQSRVEERSEIRPIGGPCREDRAPSL